MSYAARLFFVLLIGAALATAFFPALDLAVSGLFYKTGVGFYLADQPAFIALHVLAVKGAWALGVVLTLLTLTAALRSKPCYGQPAKAWAFLLLALLVGPVLVANVGLKDHWGRARPREVTAFGGTASFSSALAPQAVATKNGSFVSGDGSFGFFLPSFAYLLSPTTQRRASRRVFWGGMAAGGAFAVDRIAMGGHFLSDNLFAAILMLATSALLHTALYGRTAIRAHWRAWLGCGDYRRGFPPPCGEG